MFRLVLRNLLPRLRLEFHAGLTAIGELDARGFEGSDHLRDSVVGDPRSSGLRPSAEPCGKDAFNRIGVY
jgi:hypothetical protein